PRLQRLLADRLVREHTDEQLPLTLEEVLARDATGLDLVRLQPAPLQRLEPVVPEGDVVALGRLPVPDPPELLAVLHALGDLVGRHRSHSWSGPAARPAFLQLTGARAPSPDRRPRRSPSRPRQPRRTRRGTPTPS